MKSAALLDLLGNENRRRILRLLARKPCYVTEISEHLEVSPKAVIDHLGKLEEAGLIESRVDDGRRKYFHIARNVRLEVNLSPYRFGTKSAYPAMNLDLTRCRYVSVDVDAISASPKSDGTGESSDGTGEVVRSPDGSVDDRGSASGEGADPTADGHAEDMVTRLRQLERLEDELSMAQRWVQGRLTETVEQMGNAVEERADAGLDDRLYADVLLALGDSPRTPDKIGNGIGTPPQLVEEALGALARTGLVERNDDGWVLTAD